MPDGWRDKYKIKKRLETMSDRAYPDALSAGQFLHGYVLERVLGQGGFGITYLARDAQLDRLVAIKEYLPGEVAQRGADTSVRPRREALLERYAWGRERFSTEARTLALFDHPNIVRVYTVFEANATAYMVMRYEEGDNLARLLERRGTLPEEELLAILLPIVDGLERVHDAGFIHRDIKPENIHIRADGSPVLLDFGSACQALVGHARTVTILVAPGYAPLEQYYGDTGAQGPWTDIYSLAATCYRAIAGHPPLDAIVRTKGVLGSVRDVLEPAAVVGRGRYSKRLLTAIDHGLELGEMDRPRSLAEWRKDLDDETPAAEPPLIGPKPQAAAPSAPRQPRGDARMLGRTFRRWVRRARAVWVVGGAAAAATGIAVFVGMQGQSEKTELESQKHQLEAQRQRIEEQRHLWEAQLREEQKKREDAARRLLEAPPVAVPPPQAVPAAEAGKRPTKELAPPVAAAPKSPAKMDKPQPKQPSPIDAAPLAPAPAQVVTVEPLRLPVEARPKPPAEEGFEQAERAVAHGDYVGATKLLKPLAYGGQAQAQALLGRLDEEGHGVHRSPNEAYMWYSLAGRRGHAAALVMKERVASRMQPAEIRQADRLVEAWNSQARPGEAAPGDKP